MSYLNRLLDALTSNYNKATDGNIGKLFNIKTVEMDALKALLLKIDSWHDIDTAEGTTLDKIGKNVNQERNGLTDSQYRFFLKTAIAKNISKGDINTVLEIFSLLCDTDITNIYSEEIYPAMIYFKLPPGTVENSILQNNILVGEYIRSTLAAGVGILIDFEGTFAFSANSPGDTYVPELDEEAGFSDNNQLTGGYLGGAYTS